MNKYFKTLLFATSLVALFTYSGCGPGKDPEPSDEEVQLGKLKSTWSVSNVTLDNVSKTTDYTGFKLSVDGTLGATSFNYSTIGRPALSPWPTSGTWTFGTDPKTQLVRDPDKASDKLDISYTVTDSQLQLTFTFAREGYARTSNVKGQWVFTFTK